LSQDIEDVVYTFLVRIEGPASEPQLASNPKCFKGLLVKMADLCKKFRACHQLATAIKDIKDQVHEVANRDGRYRGPHGVVASLTGAATTRVTTTIDPRLIALYGAQKSIVGIADAKAEVMTKLFEGDDVSRKQLKILSIIGFGGLGKTTLANAVYSELSGQFDRRAFVMVSRNPDVKKVLRDLLYELDNPKFNELSGAMLLDERQLIDQLRNSLHTTRYGICVRCTLLV
jgi:disease resistance protein RPM1